MPSPPRPSSPAASPPPALASTRLPPRPFLDTLVRRVVIVWIVLKSLGTAGAATVGASPAQAFVSFPGGTVWMAAVIVLVVWVDLARRNEAVFLANLGWSYRRIAVGTAGLVVVLDGLVALLGWVAGVAPGGAVG